MAASAQNTISVSGLRARQSCGFFSSIGFIQWPGVRLIKDPSGEYARRLTPVLSTWPPTAFVGFPSKGSVMNPLIGSSAKETIQNASEALSALIVLMSDKHSDLVRLISPIASAIEHATETE